MILFLMEEAAIGDGTHDLLVNLVATFPNGTAFATGALGTSAIVVTEDQGSSGEYVGTGAQWKGAPDMSRYEVLINSEEMGISGKMTLHSVRIYPGSFNSALIESRQHQRTTRAVRLKQVKIWKLFHILVGQTPYQMRSRM